MKDYLTQPIGQRLNIGCGPIQPHGWTNIDGSNRAWLASKLPYIDTILVKLGILEPTEFNRSTVFLDLHKGLPYSSNSLACIYAGELWEHFEYSHATELTKECFRALMPNGVLRLCVPDGPYFWKKYIDMYDAAVNKPRHLQNPKALTDYVQLFFNDICTKKKYLSSMGHTHKWQYDEVQLIAMLESNGFVHVERSKFHNSRILGIEKVERSDFLIVEGVKA